MELLEHITGICGDHWHLNIYHVAMFGLLIYISNEIKRTWRYSRKITKATGIKKVVDTVSKITGKDCGCNNRKEMLNKAFPYKN